MPRGIPRDECRVCERSTDEVGPLSARGKCAGCGDRRLLENNAAMRDHRGPYFDHWRRRSLAALGVILPSSSSSLDGGGEQA